MRADPSLELVVACLWLAFLVSRSHFSTSLQEANSRRGELEMDMGTCPPIHRQAEWVFVGVGGTSSNFQAWRWGPGLLLTTVGRAVRLRRMLGHFWPRFQVPDEITSMRKRAETVLGIHSLAL